MATLYVSINIYTVFIYVYRNIELSTGGDRSARQAFQRSATGITIGGGGGMRAAAPHYANCPLFLIHHICCTPHISSRCIYCVHNNTLDKSINIYLYKARAPSIYFKNPAKNTWRTLKARSIWLVYFKILKEFMRNLDWILHLTRPRRIHLNQFWWSSIDFPEYRNKSGT